MKLTCLKCQYKGLVDATAAFMENGVMCPRCGSRMAQLLWDGSQLSALSTSTAPTLIEPMNQNQNLHLTSAAAAAAPSTEAGLDDVLEIPRILQPHSLRSSEQTLLLDDVIALPIEHEEALPVEDEEPAAEVDELDVPLLIETQPAVPFDRESFEEILVIDDDDDERTLVRPKEPVVETMLEAQPVEQNGHEALPDLSAVASAEQTELAEGEEQGLEPELFKVAQDASFDYDRGRMWVRMAPIMLFVAMLAFFALYYLGNAVKERSDDADQNASASGAPSESQAAAPAEESAPPAAATGQESASATAPAAAGGPEQSTAPQPEETAKTEAAKPVVAEQQQPERSEPARSAEPARTETQAPAEAAAPAPVASATIEPVPAPVASAPAATTTAQSNTQGAGNLTVQLGSYNKEAQAAERVERLRGMGVDARVVRAEIPRRGTWYRVQTGRFANREEAARFGAQLRQNKATQDFIVTDFQ